MVIPLPLLAPSPDPQAHHLPHHGPPPPPPSPPTPEGGEGGGEEPSDVNSDGPILTFPCGDLGAPPAAAAPPSTPLLNCPGALVGMKPGVDPLPGGAGGCVPDDAAGGTMITGPFRSACPVVGVKRSWHQL